MQPHTNSQIDLKHYEIFFVIMRRNVFNVWPKTTLLLPVWLRDAKRLDTPVRAVTHNNLSNCYNVFSYSPFSQEYYLLTGKVLCFYNIQSFLVHISVQKCVSSNVYNTETVITIITWHSFMSPSINNITDAHCIFNKVKDSFSNCRK